jgi:hypothetical protein
MPAGTSRLHTRKPFEKTLGLRQAAAPAIPISRNKTTQNACIATTGLDFAPLPLRCQYPFAEKMDEGVCQGNDMIMFFSGFGICLQTLSQALSLRRIQHCPDRNRNPDRNRYDGAQALRAAGQPVLAG